MSNIYDVIKQDIKENTLLGKRLIIGNVYIAKCSGEHSAFVKIGFAQNVRTRISTMQPGNPYLIKLTYIFSPATQAHEKWVHKKFQQYHVHKGWFQLTPELENAIQNLVLPRLEAVTPVKRAIVESKF